MSDARWIEVEDDIESACRHFGNPAMLYDQGGFDVADLSGYKSRMALLHAMQAGHTSLEAALKRVLEILGEESPAGDYSHADLIKRAARPSRRRVSLALPFYPTTSHALQTSLAGSVTAPRMTTTTSSQRLPCLR